MFNFNNISLRKRIFFSMILLVLLASVLIAAITIYQYDEQTKKYNVKRFGRKEEATKKDINIELLHRTTYPITTANLANIFQDRIYNIAQVHKLTISMYDLTGCLLKTSIPTAFETPPNELLPVELVNELSSTPNHKVLRSTKGNGITYQSSYSYITDTRFKRIGVLELQIAQSNIEQKNELRAFLERLSLIYGLMFFLAIILAYFLSSYITRSIQTISEKIKATTLNRRNERIHLQGGSSEINSLVESYNNMIGQLEHSAEKLARSEREQAWREMAKQVAHEIKNPLTPMRLSVQMFERRFDPSDPQIKQKLAEFSETLIQQIDVMSSIASAFSDFAKMPKANIQTIDIVDVVKHSLDIFTEDYISYLPQKDQIYLDFDKTQLIRIVTNLVKNATQAMPSDMVNKRIEVKVISNQKEIKIIVSDNGQGIPDEHKKRIFEPKFTTKTSGMGLGLAMIKNIIETYNGTILFTSSQGIGTVFTVTLPKK